jgi:hypothetical protein
MTNTELIVVAPKFTSAEETNAIVAHIRAAVKNTIESEMMSLSMGQLIALISDYKSMKYKPSAEYTAICEAAEAELMYREARIRRSQVAAANSSAVTEDNSIDCVDPTCEVCEL